MFDAVNVKFNVKVLPLTCVGADAMLMMLVQQLLILIILILK